MIWGYHYFWKHPCRGYFISQDSRIPMNQSVLMEVVIFSGFALLLRWLFCILRFLIRRKGIHNRKAATSTKLNCTLAWQFLSFLMRAVVDLLIEAEFLWIWARFLPGVGKKTGVFLHSNQHWTGHHFLRFFEIPCEPLSCPIDTPQEVVQLRDDKLFQRLEERDDRPKTLLICCKIGDEILSSYMEIIS